MAIRTRSLSMLGALVLGLAVTAPLSGSEGRNLHTNRLVFGGPVRLPGITLPAGAYLFERVEPVNRDVVVVRSDDRSKVYFMAMTRPAQRPEGLAADRLVTFGEVERGGVPPIAAWYPDGERVGHAFIYGPR
jgi:hypothetical protein